MSSLSDIVFTSKDITKVQQRHIIIDKDWPMKFGFQLFPKREDNSILVHLKERLFCVQ